MSKKITPEENIVLIGMPWSGKSTIGVILAKSLARPFIDTDVVIQAKERRLLQSIIDAHGADALRKIEERHVCELECSGHIIATGGSVVYSDAAMKHLKDQGVCVYLQLPYATIEERASSVESRGLVRAPGQSLLDLFNERTALYERYADLPIACEGLRHEGVLDAVKAALHLE